MGWYVGLSIRKIKSAKKFGSTISRGEFIQHVSKQRRRVKNKKRYPMQSNTSDNK